MGFTFLKYWYPQSLCFRMRIRRKIFFKKATSCADSSWGRHREEVFEIQPAPLDYLHIKHSKPCVSKYQRLLLFLDGGQKAILIIKISLLLDIGCLILNFFKIKTESGGPLIIDSTWDPRQYIHLNMWLQESHSCFYVSL